MQETTRVTVINSEEDFITHRNKKAVRYTNYDFHGRRVSSGRNAIHDYPAMLHPLLVDSLLDEFGETGTNFYDPFCGSGTALVQAAKKGLISFGTDINPLALLIAYVRGINIDSEEYQKWLNYFYQEFPHVTPDIPEVKNIDYWYESGIAINLGKVRSIISKIDNFSIRMLFLVAFSTTVRKVSYTKKNEFKRVRMSPEQLERHDADVNRIFIQTVGNYYGELEKEKLANTYQLFFQDLRIGIPFDEKVDLIVTSPPYGDSRTTVAYGQFSSFGLEWIRGLNPYGDADLKLDSILLGGSNNYSFSIPDISDDLKTILDLIGRKDLKRAKEVGIFFTDLFICIKNIAAQLNKGATVCFIVGNRNVKGLTIPMDRITIDFFEYFGLIYIETRVRRISNKRMAIKNSPSNIKGETSSTMNYEYIVIFKAES
jgi:DNA modification methylase